MGSAPENDVHQCMAALTSVELHQYTVAEGLAQGLQEGLPSRFTQSR